MNRKMTLKGLILIAIMALVSFSTVSAIEIKPSIHFDHPVILADQYETIYVQVEFDIPESNIDIRYDRPDLNLALVLDRSGSMESKGKMQYAKKAANYVIDQLSPSDRLAIIEYDDRISVLAHSQYVKSRQNLKSRIAELYPRGSTNLTGGMMSGVNQLLEYYSSRDINRVLLLSDGLANQGITDPRDIKRLVKQAKRKGITISTLGLGLDYNEDLMQMIAEYGGGTYYYIESPNQMRDIFEQEMGSIFATVCKNMKVRLRTTRHVKDFEIFGYISEEESSDIRNIGNLYAGEKISLICKLDINPSEVGEIDLGELTFEYYDVESSKQRNFKKSLIINVSENIIDKERAQNKDVKTEGLLVEADDFHEKQVKLVEAGRVDEARQNINNYAATISAINEELASVVLGKKIDALEMESEQIDRAEEDKDAMKSYLKRNKASFYQSKKGKRETYLQQVGDNGLEVKNLQKALKDKGYYTGSIDGKFSKEVKIAVEKFQKDSNLKADGIAGPKTLQLLGMY